MCYMLSPFVKRSKRVSGVKGSELIDTVFIDTVTPWWTAHMTKESLSRYALAPWNTMGSDPMVKKFFSHYAPRPLQQPQMPDMKQIKRSVCNHIRHFSLLSYLPSAGNPSTQPPIRRLALPLIRSIIQPNARAHASSYQPITQSPSFNQPRHTIQCRSG